MMISTVLMVSLGLTTAPLDTTLAVRPGDRLDLRSQRGEVHVSVWERNEIRFTLDGGARGLAVERVGSVIRARPSARGIGSGALRIEVTLPDWLAVAIHGMNTSVFVDGLDADLAVETMAGDVEVRGGRGLVTLGSQSGNIRLEGADGRIEVTAGSGDLSVRSSRGELEATTVSGTVDLRRLEATRVLVDVVSGDVTYEGSIAGDGRYEFATHTGDVTVVVPPDAGATVRVVNYSGAFETSFPVTLQSSREKEFEFTIGDGRASVRLQSFNGDVYLRRGG